MRTTGNGVLSLVALLALGIGAGGAAVAAAQGGLALVTGRVTSRDGGPVADAEVRLGDHGTRTDAGGAFRLSGVSPGTYPLVVRALGFRAHRARVTVGDREPARLEIALVPAIALLPPVIVEGTRTGVYGTVTDSARRPAAGATVHLMGRGATTVKTDSLGRFSIPAAHDTDAMLRVFLPGHLEHLFSLEVPRNEGREIAILLTPAPRARETGRADLWQLNNLSDRLRVNTDRRRLTRQDLERYGSIRLCDVPPLREVGPDPAVIVDGDIVLPAWDPCTWNADELELVEWYTNPRLQDPTASVARTLARLGGAWFGGGRRGPTPRVLLVWHRW